MATFDNPNLSFERTFTREVGNAYRFRRTFSRNPFTVNDVERIMALPVGLVIDQVKMVTHDASAGATTLDVGTTDDPDRFIAAGAINANGMVDSLTSATEHRPYKVTKPKQYLTVTCKGAAIGDPVSVSIIVIGTYEGTP